MDHNLTFDRYTGGARRALFYAHTGVSAHGGAAITDSHLLLGILKAAPELVPLIRPRVQIQRLSDCLVRAVAASSRLPTTVEVPFDAAAEAALTRAADVAEQFGQVDVTPAHLFLAVLETTSNVTGACLQSAGIDRTATVEAVTTFVRDGR